MMGDWAQVRWTEARQVAALMGDDEDALPENGTDPETHYRTVREAARRDRAVGFLGHALPRFEAIAWASRIVEQEAEHTRMKAMNRQALDYALRWLGDPNDDRRRAAMEAAEQADDHAPERMLALAVFFSGGSISLPDLPPVLPPPESAGRCAAGAILLAAHRSADAASVLDRALDLGEKVAQHGTRALDAQ